MGETVDRYAEEAIEQVCKIERRFGLGAEIGADLLNGRTEAMITVFGLILDEIDLLKTDLLMKRGL